ncbi:ATP-binding protein [Candidatus Babela massiliensis]|uniref:AAA-ATPase fused to PD-(D/E)XK nuclease superfamily n=1 Tax=Candidatus Babela massiliensis TaxID=673862 RepID=V6DH16_9BACT|nr:ATP-binding protein [Candidatus Babela massiliensis]CDK30887.1 AAA-ATPase fused to PD-(D/E)XK nuclease superfamily [Candidatus Babela massiliensis]
MLKKLPIYISSFKDMIEGNFLYIDKTKHIYDLFNGYKQYYFLSRPRRFGKSLLVSTLKELFLGNKEIFKDLWIYNSDYVWQEHPVIHLDFSVIAHRSSEQLEIEIVNHLIEIAKNYSINLDENQSPESALYHLIVNLSKINKVVILIDEYDKPILDHIKNIEEAEKQREILKSFYSVIKAQDANLRAVLLTGVSKFARTSVFSGLNNLNDITLDPKAAQLLGYTQQELIDNFMPYINNFANQENITSEALIDKLKKWYNGYRFSKIDTRVYNPFSVLYALDKREINNYWIASGNPEFLIVLLKQKYYEIKDIENAEFSYNSIEAFDISNINIIALLFQTGYLTITDYDKEYNSFKVNFPNFEIKQSFTNYLLTALSTYDLNTTATKMLNLKRAIDQNDLIKFFDILQNIFAHIPYTLTTKDLKEKDYHTLIQFILSVLSINAQSETITNAGRIDLILETKNIIYIFEFKVNQSAEIALQQIKDKKYYQRFLDKNKKIILVGLNFISSKDKIELDFIAEAIN